MRRLAATLIAAALLAGCGNDRTEPPDLGRIGAPNGFTDARFEQAGIFLRSPGGWSTIPGEPPLVATIAGGDASIAVWRYPRTEPLPETREELRAARDQLVEAVQARDAGFEVGDTRIVVKEGLRGVEIIGVGTIQGARRKVRSLHAYAHGAEVVLDAYAPVAVFDRVDEQTFGPVTRSLRLSEPETPGQ